MNTYKPTDWRRVTRLPNPEGDGHRLFRYTGEPNWLHAGAFLHRLAIADNSGPLPHLTDDGVLWLDTTRPLRLADERGLRVWVPLRQDDSAQVSTILSVQAAATLREYLPEWRLVLDDSVGFLPELFGLPDNVLTRTLNPNHTPET